MGILGTIGKIFALIGGIIVLLNIIFGLLSIGLLTLPIVNEASFGIGVGYRIIDLIIRVLAAVGLIVMFNNRFDIEDEWLQGIVIIIFGFFAGSGLGIIGGILVFIGGLL